MRRSIGQASKFKLRFLKRFEIRKAVSVEDAAFFSALLFRGCASPLPVRLAFGDYVFWGILFFVWDKRKYLRYGMRKTSGLFFRPRFFLFAPLHVVAPLHAPVAVCCQRVRLLPTGASVGESLPVWCGWRGWGIALGMWMPVCFEACPSGCESVADECGMNAVTPWFAGVCADMALRCGSWRLDGCDFCANFASSIRNRGRAHEQLLTHARELRHTHYLLII